MSVTPVVLNVGGVKFYTTFRTLTGPSSGQNSYFSNLDYTKGEIFIDRDPTVFKYILNHLRDGSVLFPNDAFTRALVYQEAKFYRLRILIEKIEAARKAEMMRQAPKKA
ncbi:K+ channel tetramerization domain protein [Ancylostoma duodenale]|uniref:K+ channel tetramerization domain protein n=1 Tax=Ancylostoma duodenale TaxID=51022 RepID=A0A0C2H861_9BILA|nr:K+ channel tetramerization domain protein [Ancylostoma duodenale]